MMDDSAARGRELSHDELILAVLREVLARQAALTSSSPGVAGADGGPAAAPVGGETRPADDSAEPAVPAKALRGTAALPGHVGAAAAHLERAGVDAAPQPGAADDAEPAGAVANEPVADGGLAGLMRRLVAGLVLAAVAINVPMFGGLPLARALPDARALVVRDGLVMKGSGAEIWVLEDNERRWVGSLEAFDHFGFRWEQVNAVTDGFLERFPEGRPLHVLLKCPDSPHIYRLEHDRKRWIRDIATFEAEGHAWPDVSTVSCSELRAIPDGVPIPADAGQPESDASTDGKPE